MSSRARPGANLELIALVTGIHRYSRYTPVQQLAVRVFFLVTTTILERHVDSINNNNCNSEL